MSYIRIISFGYGMMEVHRYCGFFLTGLHKPMSATALNIVRVLVFLIPLSYIGAHFWGVTGVFAGRLTTDIIVGCVGLAWVSRSLGSAVEPTEAARVPDVPSNPIPDGMRADCRVQAMPPADSSD